MQEAREERPPLSPTMTGTDLQRWYWLKTELMEFARLLGLSTAGGKTTLTARITEHLDGRAFHEGDVDARRPPPRHPLRAPLLEDSLIPEGQRCGQVLRAWFREQVGPTFIFDAAMRDFFTGTDGTQTLGDALSHWRLTRESGTTPIDQQFEYNRFTRAWSSEHPQETREALLTAWWQYRSTPVDERGSD